MKIVQVSTWEVPCGIAGYTKALVNGIKANHQECDVISIDRQKLKYMCLREIKHYFSTLVDEVKNYDVIHIQHEFSFFAGCYGTNESIEIFAYFLNNIAKLRKKVFVTFHSEPDFPLQRDNIFVLLKSVVLRQRWKISVASIFNSNSHVKAILHTKKSRRVFIDYGFNPSKIIVTKQGVTWNKPLEVSEEEKLLAKEKLGFPADAIILSLFGFIAYYKGHEIALEAMKYLPENYYLLFIGSPHPYGKDDTFNRIVYTLNRRKKLSDRIKLTGYLPLEVLTEYYKIVDICLAPYRGGTNLSSSAAITWALTSGKPVIASKIDSFEELNEETDCLSLTTPDASAELAYAIQSLVLDVERQERLVNNALEYCEENQWKSAGKKHLDIYSN
jgi:glycosyltransferase involved in cell wall biosynthesis